MAGNYEKMKEKARQLFLLYDQKEIIKKSFVDFDASYIYVDFCKDHFLLNRRTGEIYIKAKDELKESDFNASLTIYDLLTHDNGFAVPSNEYCSISSLNVSERTNSKDIGGSSDDEAKYIDAYKAAYISACKKFGKEIKGLGDINFEFELFSFMRIQIRFWKSDEEFPAKLQIMVDKNILSFILFETVYYAMGYLLNKIFREMDITIKDNN